MRRKPACVAIAGSLLASRFTRIENRYVMAVAQCFDRARCSDSSGTDDHNTTAHALSVYYCSQA